MKTKKLTGKQASHLRGLGHNLSPVIHIGKEGITDNLVKSTDMALDTHELIKGKVQENCPVDRKDAPGILAQKTRSLVAQILGKTFLLYRENKDKKDDKKIVLPK